MSYYDNAGLIIKKQTTRWQKIKDAWVWKTGKTGTMENMERHTSVVYDLTQAEANTGLKDNDFSQRALKQDGNR